jgi:isochorismate hydrolase
MKNTYFTNNSIDLKSLEMLKSLEDIRKREDPTFVPSRSALLILDMQRVFLEEDSHAFIPSALPIIPKIKKLASKFQKKNLPVIFTRHINNKEDAKLMADWWNGLITEKDEMSEIIPDLDLSNTLVIRKTQYDGFYQTHLEEILKERETSQIVITGVMSHLCCETTARSAFVRGYEVFFPINGTATYNEEFHRATVLNLSHGFAIPCMMEDLQNTLETTSHGN